MNILLLSMSSFPRGDMDTGKNGTRVRKLQENRFTYDNSKGEKIERKYYSQLEPITEMLIEEGKLPDEVIMLCTKESITEMDIKWGKEEKKISPCEFYKYRINEYKNKCNKYDYKEKRIKYRKIPRSLDDTEDSKKASESDGTIDANLPKTKKETIDPDLPESKRKAVAEVAAYLLDKKKDNKDLRVWIDTQGGMRDISLLMNAVVSLLKTSAITIEDIYSINFTDGIGKIMKQNDTYRIFDFVSGMNEFIEYGRADQLVKYYQNIEQKEPPKIIHVMQQLSNAIMVCDTEAFDVQLETLRREINHYKGSENDVLFSVFMEQIRVDYKNLLDDACTALDVIEWLSAKKMYQQALTYLESKIPQEWEKLGILNFSETKETAKIDAGRKSEFQNVERNVLIGCVYRVKDMNKQVDAIKKGEVSDKTVCTLVEEANPYRKSWIRVRKGFFEEVCRDRTCKRLKLPVNYKNVEYKNIEVTTKVEEKDANKLYQQLLMYKLLKEERNLWCHMLVSNHMDLDDLNGLIEKFIANGRELYKAVNK